MSLIQMVNRALAGRPDDWRSELARQLAKQMDDDPNASIARELRAVMRSIDDDSPAKPRGSVADELRRRRAARIAGAETGESSGIGDVSGG